MAGDVAGNYRQLFNRIETILKKSGPFEVRCVCVDILVSDVQGDMASCKVT